MYSNNELIERIQHGESDQVEFTESADKLDKIREAICAFANDLPNHNTPGVIFIGLKDDHRCANLSIDDNLLQKIGGLRSDGKILPFPSIEVSKKQLQDCEVAIVQVEPSENPPVKVDNRCWIRIGPRRAQATAEEERRLTEKRRWHNLPYDTHSVIGTSIEDDIDMEQFKRNYLPSAVTPKVLQENERSSNEQMQALRLITLKNIPTVTAILMFGNDVRYWFPGGYIQFTRYGGNEITEPVKDHKEINGTLPEQLKELDRIIKSNISTVLDTSGETHAEWADYPYAALRELVRNAVIHRNYESSTTPVKIYWYADKIQITSPGGVYGEVTRENFGQGATSYRNPTVAEAMKHMGFMQKFGSGIAIAQKTLQDNGNPPAHFGIEENFVCATIEKRP